MTTTKNKVELVKNTNIYIYLFIHMDKSYIEKILNL